MTETVELIPKDQAQAMKRHFSDPSLVGLSKHVVEIEGCAPISVYIQGNLEKGRDGPVFMTIHDVGSSFHSMVDFVNHEDMAEVKNRCLFLHVSIYGCAHKAKDITHDFPSLQTLGLGLITVLDQLMIKEVVVLGQGAGAYMALRFGFCHPTRTLGLVLINPIVSQASPSVMEMIMEKIMGTQVTADEPSLNTNNIQKYAEAFKNRVDMTEELTEKIKFDILLLTGAQASQEDADLLYSKATPGKASIIKIEDVEDPVKQAQEKIADPIILFAQGLGWMATAKRKSSIKSQSSVESQGDQPQLARRISMEQYDTPNVRRFSLDRH